MLKKIMLFMTLLLLISGVAMAGTVDLPQTGQTTCYDADGTEISCTNTGQDGDVRAGVEWPSPRFTDNGDSTVTDNLAGLMWTQDAGTPAVGTDGCSGGVKSWQDALTYVACLNTINYLGYSDWRLPNMNELESLLKNAEEANLVTWLNGEGFANVRSAYWTSSTYVPSAGSAWCVSISNNGTNMGSGKPFASNIYVWPVRATTTQPAQLWKTGQTTCYDAGGTEIPCTNTGQDGDILAGVAWPEPRFTGDGDCVIDNLTGLMWPRNGNLIGEDDTWANAIAYANSLSLCGYDDWRLPSRDEIRSLINAEESDTAAWLNGEGFTNVQSDSYWSSTTRASYTAGAWTIHMLGFVGSNGKSYKDYVWPVRAGLFGDSDISVSAEPVDFGNVQENTQSDKTVTVTNNGTYNLNVGGIASANPLASPFSIVTDNCSNQTVSPAANCTLTVRFSPTSTGDFTDSFDIPSNDPDENPVTVNVSGTGTAAPVPDIDVTDSVDPSNDLKAPFGDVTVNDTSDKTVTVTNNGSADLIIGTIANANPLALPFSIVTDNCSNQTVSPAVNCTLEVRFSPTATASYTDSFDIPSNDPDEDPVTLTVSGTGESTSADSDGDGVPDSEDENPNDATAATPQSATGTGKITVDTSSNSGTILSDVQALSDIDASLSQTGKPSGFEFKHGLMCFKVNGLELGDTVQVDISFPAALPAGTKYYKVNDGGFYEFTGAVISGRTVTLTLQDGGSGDKDETVNGVIDDPGGVASPESYTEGSDSRWFCFIATAAYGSYLDPHVKVLRDFRDRFMLGNAMGKAFVDFYYAYSPSMAGFIAKHDSLRAAVRWGLLPLVGIGWMTLHFGPWGMLPILAVMLALMISAAVIVRKWMVLFQMRVGQKP